MGHDFIVARKALCPGDQAIGSRSLEHPKKTAKKHAESGTSVSDTVYPRVLYPPVAQRQEECVGKKPNAMEFRQGKDLTATASWSLCLPVPTEMLRLLVKEAVGGVKLVKVVKLRLSAQKRFARNWSVLPTVCFDGEKPHSIQATGTPILGPMCCSNTLAVNNKETVYPSS
ncbi:hypothetical protein Q8A73_002000 [Channa argus]|nr:hypothetical protein Q8A73_002000 [Channa argus]